MKKKYIIQIIQIVLIALLICFKIFIFPEIQDHAGRTFIATPLIFTDMAFWVLVGFVFALPKFFAKGKLTLNPFYLVLELVAITGIVSFWFGLSFLVVPVMELLCLIAGFFFIDCIKSYDSNESN